MRQAAERKYDRLRAALIEARLKAALTQVELAKRLGRSQSFVSKYEKGERRLNVLEFLDIADELASDPSRLLAGLAGTRNSGKH